MFLIILKIKLNIYFVQLNESATSVYISIQFDTHKNMITKSLSLD